MALFSEQQLLMVRPMIDAVLRHQHLSGDCLFKLRGMWLKKKAGTLQCSECALSLFASLSLCFQMYVGVRTTVRASRKPSLTGASPHYLNRFSLVWEGAKKKYLYVSCSIICCVYSIQIFIACLHSSPPWAMMVTLHWHLQRNITLLSSVYHHIFPHKLDLLI